MHEVAAAVLIASASEITQVVGQTSADLGSLIPGALGALLGGLGGVVLADRLARWREEHQRVAGRIANIKPFYFEEYLGPKIKEARKALQTHASTGAGGQHALRDTEVRDYRDRLSKGLQRIGVLIRFDGIPLEFALAMNGYQIVTDWLLIYPFVYEIRGTNSDDEAYKKWLKEPPFHRRHAEWLALICWIWADGQKFKLRDELQNELSKFETHFGESDELLDRERLLFKCDACISGPATGRLRKKILGDFRRKPKICEAIMGWWQ